MSRSGYHDDCDDNWALICWRGAVASAIRGRRGQAFLREGIAALDAMPEKQLVRGELQQAEDGAVCFIGAIGAARGVDMSEIDPEDYTSVAAVFGISESLAREIVFENDENGWRETPADRHSRMRRWAESLLRP